MLRLIMNMKEAINQLISDHVQNAPHQFQLQGKFALVKFVEEDDQFHMTTSIVTTAMYNLYFGGVTNETTSEIIDQMVNTITIFGFHRSG